MTDEDDDDAQEETRTNTRDNYWPNAAVYSSHCSIHSILFFVGFVITLESSAFFGFLLFFSSIHTESSSFSGFFLFPQFYSNCTCALCICRIFYARNASNHCLNGSSERKERVCLLCFVFINIQGLNICIGCLLKSIRSVLLYSSISITRNMALSR